jgi:NitT/TauT family transport system permease protein
MEGTSSFVGDARNEDALDQELAGLDTLSLHRTHRESRAIRLWRAAWPKLGAVAIAIGLWQLIDWWDLKPDYVLPGPRAVFTELGDLVQKGDLWKACATTLQRAAMGFALAMVIGTVIGLALTRSRFLRAALGSLITGLASMPSIVWFPFAILYFGLTESAIMFVVVLGAFPSIANGVLAGVDHIPPILLRAGRVLGARGMAAQRHVVLPAALPGYIAGLKQGWAFAWRSLMAGEIIVIITAKPSLGQRLAFARELSDMPLLMAYMIVILIIGMLVDSLIFGSIEKRVRANRGLIEKGEPAEVSKVWRFRELATAASGT